MSHNMGEADLHQNGFTRRRRRNETLRYVDCSIISISLWEDGLKFMGPFQIRLFRSLYALNLSQLGKHTNGKCTIY